MRTALAGRTRSTDRLSRSRGRTTPPAASHFALAERDPSALLELQRQVGNRAVADLVSRAAGRDRRQGVFGVGHRATSTAAARPGHRPVQRDVVVQRKMSKKEERQTRYWLAYPVLRFLWEVYQVASHGAKVAANWAAHAVHGGITGAMSIGGPIGTFFGGIIGWFAKGAVRDWVNKKLMSWITDAYVNVKKKVERFIDAFHVARSSFLSYIAKLANWLPSVLKFIKSTLKVASAITSPPTPGDVYNAAKKYLH